MKKITIAAGMLVFLLCSCSGKTGVTSSTSSSSSATSALVLNASCKSTSTDTGFIAALSKCVSDSSMSDSAKCNLDSIKTHLSGCASVNMSAYLTKNLNAPKSVLANINLHYQSNDSVVIYLLANGADSIGRAYSGGLYGQTLLGNAIEFRDSALFNYLLSKDYPSDPWDITYAIQYNMKSIYDSLMARSPNLDSAWWETNQTLLGGICTKYAENSDIYNKYLPYFYDILTHTINVNELDGGRFPTIV